jgi:hypothetical protein
MSHDNNVVVGTTAQRSLLFDTTTAFCDGPFAFLCDIWIVLRQILCRVVPLFCPVVPDPPTSQCPLWQNPVNATPACRASSSSSSNLVLPVCVAIRGNAQRVVAHFPMLAKIVQVLGPVSGAAAMSSGTVSMFLLDAMQSNPIVVECPGGGTTVVCCGLDEQKARLSFLLKSFTGIKSGFFWAEDILSIVETFRIQNILGLLRSKSNAVAQDALTVLLSILQAAVTKDNESLINPEFIQSILTSANPIAAAIDLVSATFALQSILGSGTAAADEPKLFVRPGLINFRRIAQITDLVACFYRGLHPVDLTAMRSIVDDCAMRSVDLSSWAEIANLSTANGSSCGDRFDRLFRKFQLARGDNAPSMLQDPVGGNSMRLIGHASVLTGRAVQIWQDARAAYRTRPDAPIAFDVDFDDVKLGFFGQDHRVYRHCLAEFSQFGSHDVGRAFAEVTVRTGIGAGL